MVSSGGGGGGGGGFGRTSTSYNLRSLMLIVALAISVTPFTVRPLMRSQRRQRVGSLTHAVTVPAADELQAKIDALSKQTHKEMAELMKNTRNDMLTEKELWEEEDSVVEPTTTSTPTTTAARLKKSASGALLSQTISSRDEVVEVVARQADVEIRSQFRDEEESGRPTLADLEKGLPDEEDELNYGVLTRDHPDARTARRARQSRNKAEQVAELGEQIVKQNLLAKRFHTDRKEKTSLSKSAKKLIRLGAVDGFDFVGDVDSDEIIEASLVESSAATDGGEEEEDGFDADEHEHESQQQQQQQQGDKSSLAKDVVAVLSSGEEDEEEERDEEEEEEKGEAAATTTPGGARPPRPSHRNRTKAASAFDASGKLMEWVNGAGSVDDLPGFGSADDAGSAFKSKLQTNVADFGIKMEDLIYHGGNILKQLRTLTPLKELPQSFPAAFKGMDLSSCALVGNSGVMMHNIWMHSIDSHGAVVRLNQGPTRRYTNHVGTKTHMRILNTRWAHKYTLPDGAGVAMWDLPLDTGEKLLLARVSVQEANEVVDALKGSDGYHSRWYPPRGDVKIMVLSPKAVSAIRTLLMNYRRRLLARGFKPGSKSTTPSTGLLAAWTLSQICGHVTLYGFGLNKFGINRLANGAKVPYHYFSKGERAADDRMNPTHSFDVEYALLRAMHREGMIYLCDVASSMTCGSRRDRTIWKKAAVAREACGEACADAILARLGKNVDHVVRNTGSGNSTARKDRMEGGGGGGGGDS
ncbi:glycosyltransferase family 29 protein [Pseudoscourfieldia marina]